MLILPLLVNLNPSFFAGHTEFLCQCQQQTSLLAPGFSSLASTQRFIKPPQLTTLTMADSIHRNSCRAHPPLSISPQLGAHHIKDLDWKWWAVFDMSWAFLSPEPLMWSSSSRWQFWTRFCPRHQARQRRIAGWGVPMTIPSPAG